jgi:hypothetical protein
MGRPEQLSVSWSFASSHSDGSIDPQNGNNKGRPSVALCRADDTRERPAVDRLSSPSNDESADAKGMRMGMRMGMMKHHHHHHIKKT